ncbi:MAG: CDP-paratose 2-epimerase [Acidobacteria bacterium]|nr:MAG: CDP-paratose 2-epimerase [Acidobacteriota bacterium]
MTERIFEKTIWVPASPGYLFDFFSRAENLQLVTPSWLSFQILTPLPIEMRLGARIDYRIRLYGWPVTWRTQITGWEPPRRFEDTQLAGPYRLWVHEHLFEAENAGTRMVDRVRYLGRGGPFEPLVNSLLVRSRLEKIFAFREEAFRQLFAQPPDPARKA